MVHKQTIIWQFIADNILKHTPVMLLYVLESNGSSPGRQGFAMTVNSLGEMEGSIGGGIMEHKFVEMAKTQLLISPEPVADVRKQIHDKQAAKNQSGMICSGDQTIFLYKIQYKDTATVAQIIDSLRQNKNGRLQLSPDGISFSEDIPDEAFYFKNLSAENWLFQEKVGYKNRLFIIGGGHCALAFSKLMSGMDFYLHLFEHRDDLHTLQKNEFVHQKTIIDDYSELKNLISSGANNYVVVMTVGYRTDVLAIHSLLGKDFKYFGVLGSQKKIAKLFSDYIAEGIDETILKKIHAPIGLAIKSETPEEIAVSIAAQIIQVKNQ